MTSGNPRNELLDAVAGELRAGPLARRRIIAELADHIEDAANDLRDSGVAPEEAIERAVTQLGDAETIASAFAALRTRTAAWSQLRRRQSLAWIAAAAMSVVTAWAAELPQASGAKPPAKVLVPSSPTAHQTKRGPVRRHRALVRPGRGRGTGRL